MSSPTINPVRQNRWRHVLGRVLQVAFLAVCGVLAVMASIMIQRAPQVRAEKDRQQAAEIATENRGYCEKWGMQAGTREHATCMHDLDEIRARHTRRLSSEDLISEWE